MDSAIIVSTKNNSRLAGEDFPIPRALVSILGESLIERQVRLLKAVGVENIYIVIDKQYYSRPKRLLGQLRERGLVHVLKGDIPCPLRGLQEISKTFPQTKELCLLTADMIFSEREFTGLISEFRKDESIHELLGVTSIIVNGSPLYVRIDDKRRIIDVNENSQIFHTHVSGGIYCFRTAALTTANVDIGKHVKSMYDYQCLLLEQDLHLKAYTLSQIVEINRPKNIRLAEALLSRGQAHAG